MNKSRFQFGLRDMLIAFAWASIALVVFGDYYKQHIAMERAMSQNNHLIICWVPRVSTFWCIPLAVASGCALFGRHRRALALAIPSILGAAYQLWAWYVENAEYMSIPGFWPE